MTLFLVIRTEIVMTFSHSHQFLFLVIHTEISI